MGIFALENLTFTYPQGALPALREISLEIEEGEFLLLCGASGSGKTTLLRLMKPVISPVGEEAGSLFYGKEPLKELPVRRQVAEIGYVQQNPDVQLVTDTVLHEVAFGLESLGTPAPEIRRRVAEMASFFGLQPLLHRPLATLSGGQKQLVNLAAVLAQRPRVLLLDEPTAQLDPIAAASFLQLVQKVNREFSVTVVLCEQNLEEAAPYADRAAVLSAGALFCCCPPKEAALLLHRAGSAMERAFPAAARIGLTLQKTPVPMTVREGRAALRSAALPPCPPAEAILQIPAQEEAALSFCDVWHRYEKQGHDIAKGLSFTVKKGEIYAVLGGNGEGKTTLLSLACRLFSPYAGKVFLNGRPLKKYTEQELFHGQLALLPQNAGLLFSADTLEKDLCQVGPREEALHLAQKFGLTALLARNPLDLSGGEGQRAALIKVLMSGPALLLLDEPTKGLDVLAKEQLARDLAALKREGKSVLLVSHDMEFCAGVADRCGLLFEGQIVSEGAPHAFFSENEFYTTAARRIARGILENVVTTEEVLALCKAKQIP